MLSPAPVAAPPEAHPFAAMAPKRRAPMPAPAPVAAPPEPMPAPAIAVPARPPRGIGAAAFYAAVAASCGKMTAKQVRTVLIRCKEVVAAEFGRGVSQVGIPHLCRLRMRTRAARGPSSKIAFGKEVQLKARAATRVLRVTPQKTLKDMVYA